MIDKLILNFIVWYCHRSIRKAGYSTMWYKGIGEHFPRFFVYTESEIDYERLEELQ